MTIALATPSVDLYDSWAATVSEFGGVHIDGAGLELGTVPTTDAVEAFIEKAALYGRPGATLPDGHVACDYFWITDADAVVGFIAFRRELNEHLRRVGGHIGYAVAPSRRREGIAGMALGLLLDRARSEGYERVMLTCDDDNVASARTIEGAGGELEDIVDGASEGYARLRRYWIPLG